MSGLFPFALEGLLTEDQAKSLTEPIWARGVQTWFDSWHRGWMSAPEEFRARVGKMPIARANVLSALAISYAKENFADSTDDRELKICRKLGFFKLYVVDPETGHCALVRFKSLRSDFLVSPAKSEQGRKFYNNATIAGVDNSATRLNIGYMLNASRDEIEAVYVTCQIGLDVAYKFRIDSEVVATPVPVPAGQPAQPSVAAPHITIRKAK